MTDKIRVKDLAADLNMQPKDLLVVIKELSIIARASNSVLADEEVARIKDRIIANSQPERREGTDIIVRRKRKDVEEPKPETPEEKPAQAEADPARSDQDGPAGKIEAASPPQVAKTAGEDALTKPADKPHTAKIIQAPPSVPSTARIVSRPDLEQSQKSGITGKTDPARKTASEEKKSAAPNLSAEPEKNAAGLTVSSAPAPAPTADYRRGSDQDALMRKTDLVRVVSLPPTGQQPAGRRDSRSIGRGSERDDQRQNERQRPGAEGGRFVPGKGRSTGDSSRPSAGRPSRFTSPRPLPGEGMIFTEADGRAGKKRQKGKRAIDFGEEMDRRSKGTDGDEGWRRQPRRGKGAKGKHEPKASTAQPIKAAKRKIRMEEFIRVSDMAHQIGIKASELIKVLFNLGVMATINQSLDFDTAVLVAAEFEYEVEKFGFSEENIISAQVDDDPSKMSTRPPVVTIMGHVDHGKTSLLDAIRKTSVTAGEAGGITQHIGAYHVSTKKGAIVFLDTPGHEAFTAMRARGAEVTDIVVLVVAADDGVMEQTREAINHAKAAGVPIMVAVNKMDKEQANPDRIRRELAELGMVPEEWGGEVTFSYLSAKTRQGLDDFLELLALQAEILELKANPDQLARGHIVEARLDKGRGSLGTVLIQHGTLRVGDTFVCGVHYGRVRAMFDDQGKKVAEASPSIPVEVQGFEGVPEAGEEFICLADEKAARRIAETRALKQRERELAKESKVTLETFLSRRADDAEAMVLNLVLKADVQGSLEAIQDQLKKLSNEKVRINIIHSAAGAISESDVLLASTSEAIIIGFNVRPNPKTKELAEAEKIDIRFYDIIYKLVEEIKSAMEGMLAPVEKEVFLGTADVRETFNVPKVGVIAGCHISDGKIVRNARIRLLRDSVVVYTGKILSLKRFKDDVKEVLKGYECGISIENYNDIKTGDVIEAFEIVEEAAKL